MTRTQSTTAPATNSGEQHARGPHAQQQIAGELLRLAGTTYAADAGIRLANTPAPLYRLLLLSVLLSARIQAGIAVRACAELIAAGYGTPKGMLGASWQDRVDALGRGSYTRYDESTATALGTGAEILRREYGGDLRRLRERAGGDVATMRELLQEVPRLGPLGADIFCREAQLVWPELRPYLDGKARRGAVRLGLAADESSEGSAGSAELAQLVDGEQLAPFAAALVRVSSDAKLLRAVTGDAASR